MVVSRNVEIRCRRCGKVVAVRRMGDAFTPEDMKVMDGTYCKKCQFIRVVTKK